jgi:hypothetical protein
VPIIIPKSCRNVTAGALRQIKEDGFTFACGGWHSKESLSRFVVAGINFDRTEPAGVFMATLENAKELIEENTEAIATSAGKLVDAAKQANKQMTDVTGKFRDGTEKLGNAIDKLMKVAGRSDFAETVKLTESLVLSLERLAALEEKGLLDKVMKAMSTQ